MAPRSGPTRQAVKFLLCDAPLIVVNPASVDLYHTATYKRVFTNEPLHSGFLVALGLAKDPEDADHKSENDGIIDEFFDDRVFHRSSLLVAG